MSNSPTIAIIDYDAGNLTSVRNAFEFVGQVAEVVRSPNQLDKYQRFVLPGVGAFGPGIAKLRTAGFVDALNTEVLESKKPLLCICLGMQLLATTSYEHGKHTGLNWIPGEVVEIEKVELGLRVPHVGWNEVRFVREDPSLEGLGGSADFYFANSFHFIPKEKDCVVGTYHHGQELVGIIRHDNIFAVQFHPEKSHNIGLSILRKFAAGSLSC